MTHTELFPQFVAYHQGGDANVEGRCIANICDALRLSEYDRFRLCYYYATCYNIDSALRLLENPRVRAHELAFRTDRRWVGYVNRFPKIIRGCNDDKFQQLRKARSIFDAVSVVENWYYFGRYAAYLFAEIYIASQKTQWVDDLHFNWEPEENYTLGAKSIIREHDNRSLDFLLDELKTVPTEKNNSNSLAIETGLCGWWKILKGTRWNGYYTERMISEALESKFRDLILDCAN